jgi:hypothetical protein
LLWGCALWEYNVDMRFQVPQFIEMEDKIFGEMTFKQFIYLAGGGGISFLIYTILPFYLAAPIILIIAGFSVALAFYKVHGRFPFIYLVEAATKYFVSNKLYIWKKEEKKPNQEVKEVAEMKKLIVPKLSESKLKDLTWSLDIHESIYSDKNQR